MKKVLYFPLFFLMAAFIIGADAKEARAFSYAGYRWGGSWPYVTVDYSPVAVNAWRNIIANMMSDWNNTRARYIFQAGSSNNKVTVTWRNSHAIATTSIYRQWWGGGNVSKVTVAINSYHAFYPVQASGYDLATVMRHEFGHWLVLNHTNPPSLMQPSLSPREVQYVGLDDRNGIRYIYGTR
ncbi:MAG: matrixin family metalloprotease [Patescibacteria group bacterium]